MDLAAIKEAGKDTTIVVVMTNTDQIDSFELSQTGQQKLQQLLESSNYNKMTKSCAISILPN